MTPASATLHRVPSWTEWLIACVIGCCLSAFVWQGLLAGGGLVGGDTYPYFFPQKQMMAEVFARGEIPLWHDRTSLGYPLHAESQAGIFYPTNQILYRIFDINSAYNASVLLHYVLAFLFTWRFAKSQMTTQTSSLLVATVFVYGWFPVRVSLEWSIIGGVWFPLCLWMVDRLLEKPSRARWTCLAMCFGVHLLAGHFTLAFITQLTCLAYALLSRTAALPFGGDLTRSQAADSAVTQNAARTHRWKSAGLVIAAIVCGILIAAVQLIPTLELRQLSQRDGSNTVFNPAYGHMPPVYLTQLVASWWYWHTPEMAMSREMQKIPFLMMDADTNPVEAHLYLGLIPLILVCCVLREPIRQRLRHTQWRTWAILSVAGIVYSFGWLVPLFRHLPGFGFFMGPGRYTMIACLGLAIIAGLVLDVLQRRQRAIIRTLITVGITALTLADVLKSAEPPVCDAQVVPHPPMDGLRDSWVARALDEDDQKSPVRLLLGGPNIGNLYGVSSVPQYLGLGPAEYFASEPVLETQPTSQENNFPSAEQMIRLKSMAVTHVLTSDEVKCLSDECVLVANGPDAFLNRVWGRGGADCFLYRIKQPKFRVSATPEASLKDWSMTFHRPSEIEFQVELATTAKVELCELMFPGWNAFVDDQPTKPVTSSGFGRTLEIAEGSHTIRWIYDPRSFRIGALISLTASLGLAIFCRPRGVRQR